MAEETVIRIDNVSKDFILPHEKATSIKSLFTGLARRRRRKTDEIQHALKDISFDIKEGEFFGIVGRNGSGKSTLLKILAGIYQPSDGRVHTRGKLVPFIELGVGFNPELTGRENVYLNGAMLGFSEQEVDAMYDSIVKFAELERFMDQKLKNYSSGMQVRLAFSMAIRADADILLIDEVLAVGDADFQRKCYNYFRRLKREKKTVVFVSHDMEAVREYCDRAALIEKNAVQKIGETARVAEEYTKLFTAAEQGEANEKEGRWGNGAVKTAGLSVSIGEEIVISQKITATRSLEGPIPGFRIRDASGREVTGTNSKIERQKLPDMKKGQSLSLTWRLPNILSDGRYTLDPAILEADGITVADWWDDAYEFTVKKPRHLPYAIDPEFTLEIS